MNSRREQTEGIAQNIVSITLFVCLDLKAFEQRLTECVEYVESTTSKWRSEGHDI